MHCPVQMSRFFAVDFADMQRFHRLSNQCILIHDEGMQDIALSRYIAT